ncbi:MAG: C25 family cysteine peptidase [Lentimicrobiaceae bacterium]|nr:C25 family cysteine peptidase [Lentimicrobiaceae bacterium]
MKKLPLFILLFVFTTAFIINLFSQTITYSHLRSGTGVSIHLELKSYNINSLNYKGEAMHEIMLSGIFIPNDEGLPNLPKISRLVAIPQGAEVSISIKNIETETLENINIAPALRIQAIPEEPVMDYVKNQKIYTTNEFYPQNPVEISEVTSFRGVNAVMVGITPFQFNPVTKELIVINNIEIEIEYVGGSTLFADPKYRSPWFDPILKNALLNHEVLPEMEYTGKSHRDGEGCEYLIVIPNREDFEPYAEQIKEFRTKQGIYTKVMRLDEMGVTTTTQLKSYFHNAYNTWAIPPVAVLLMGDHNTNMNLGIPAEVIYHPYSGTCITDNQYADVTGDFLPEMVFSRMAAETEAQMAVLVSKFIEYETQPCMEPGYYQNPITALGFQTERWFQICSEAVGGYWRKQEKTPVRINEIYQPPQNTSIWSSAQNTSMVTNYFGPSGAGYIPASPNDLGNWSGGTAMQVVAAVNNGAFALQHRDHGFEDGWGEPGFRSSHINLLTNVGKMTYVFTINCSTGKFNNNTPCFGERFHRYTYQEQNAGCVGFLGPTEVSYSFVNDVFTWGMYDLFDPNFLPTYGHQGPHAAAYSGNWMPAFGNVAGKYFLHQSNWVYSPDIKILTNQMFTAHSDVFLRLFTEVPQALIVDHAEIYLTSHSNFYIKANEGALIALTALIDGKLEILAVTTATGKMQAMTIPVTLTPGTEINVVCTGQNFLRYEGVAQVIQQEGPYMALVDYTIVSEEPLTYLSENREIEFILKNTGTDPTAAPLTITVSCDDPLLTIHNGTTQVANSIDVAGIVNANFNITIAYTIPDHKVFPIIITVTDDNATTWQSKMSLKADAPKFFLEKVLVNNVEDDKLEDGAIATLTAVVRNVGHADAYAVTGAIGITGEFITLICNESGCAAQDLPVGERINLNFTIATDPALPANHETNFDLLLAAQYGLSFSLPFKVSSSDYCITGTTNCSGSKFESVRLIKTSDLSVLINNTETSCATTGYQDYTNLTAVLEPGEQYTIVVKATQILNNVRGWIDLNGNKTFDANEQLIALTCMTPNTEYAQDFTIPQDAVPGTFRFRLRTRRQATPDACDGYATGQTHDYTIVIPETHPRVQNVVAVLTGANMTINWDAPTGEAPGYNIYRNGNCLNATPLMHTSFTEENIVEGIYFYHVTAVYTDNKESVPEISNFICTGYTPPQLCEKPSHLLGVAAGNTAVMSWNKPKYMDGILLGYNIYRDDLKIDETEPTIFEYFDTNLADGIYRYQVSAVYEHCEESVLTNGINIAITPVGIHEVQTDAFQIFPNPTTGELRIVNYELEIKSIDIFDVMGRKVSSHHLITSSSNHHINLSHLQSGIYFIKVYSETNQVTVKRLVLVK